MSTEHEAPQRPLTGGAVMSAISRVTVAVTGALGTVIVARLLGPAGAGGYALAQTFILMLVLLTTLGVEHGMAYYVSTKHWAAPDALRSSYRVSLVTGAVGVALGVGARLVIPKVFGNLSVLDTAFAAAALPFAVSWLYFSYVVLAIDHYEAYVLPPAIQSTLGLLFVGVGAATSGLRGAVIGFTLAHVLVGIGARIAAPRVLAKANLPPVPHEPRMLRRAVRFGIKAYAANALQFVNFRLGLFVLAAVGTSADVGHYSVALAVTTVLWLLPQALSDTLLPRIASLGSRMREGDVDLRAFVEAKSLRHTALIVYVSTIGLAAVLVLLVEPIYGPAFEPAVDLGLILLPGVALIGISGTLTASFVGRGHPEYSFAITLITTPLTIALYLILIPAHGATGAVVASTISYTVTFLLAAFGYWRVTGANVLSRLVPTRSEFADYRALGATIRQQLAARARRG